MGISTVTVECSEIMGDDFEQLECSLRGLVDNKELRWLFVGGKGGVGKTTCSSSIASLLAAHRESVLLVSTDPAHNLSDAFGQQFTRTPSLVSGFTNLYAMEIDPTDIQAVKLDALIDEKDLNPVLKELGIKPGQSGLEAIKQTLEQINIPGIGDLASLTGLDDLEELIGSAPGIDEAMSFLEILRLVKSMKYSTIVFDTAPTGHTLRLLALPKTFEKTVEKVLLIKSKFEGLVQEVSNMVMPGANLDDLAMGQFEEFQQTINAVAGMFKDEKRTSFICVCIPEMLSLYETERLIQELVKFEINVENIVVNQIVYPPPGSTCQLCNARSKMQKKQLEQIRDLYGEDFHIVHLPLLPFEVRTVTKLQLLGEFLFGQRKPEEGAVISPDF